MSTSSIHVYSTQGGGLVKRDPDGWVFVEAPANGTGLQVGDYMPEEWSIGGYVGTVDETRSIT